MYRSRFNVCSILCVLGLVCLLAGAVMAQAPALANSNTLYRQLRTVGLGTDTVSVSNLVLKRDVATLTFTSGQFFFLSPVEGRVTGAVFIGEGKISLVPASEVERKMVSRLTGMPLYNDTFTEMVLRFTDGTAQEIKSAGTTASGGNSGKATSLLEDNRKLLRKGHNYQDYNIAASMVQYNLDLRLLEDLTWEDQGGLFRAYYKGKEYGEMLLGLDPLGLPAVAPEEVALACFDAGNLGVWYSGYLGGDDEGSGTDEQRIVDMEHVTVDDTADKERLEAKVTVRYKSLVDGLRVLPLDLFHELRMKKVTDEAGHALEFIQEDKDEDADFGVILPTALKKDQVFSLTYEYSGDKALSDEGGQNYTLVARSNWYPNTTFGDRATWEMTLRVPKGLTLVATGQPLGDERQDGDYSVTRWKSDVPLAVAGFNYGKFKKTMVKDKKDNYIIESYANKHVPDFLRSIQRNIEFAEQRSGANSMGMALGNLNTLKLMDKARSEALVSIELYSDLYGKLPYKRIAMTQQPFPSFGQAWPMLVYMPITAYLDDTVRHQFGMTSAANFFKYVAAHEVAHQWWGHMVGWRSYRDQWLSEGFAEFSASMFAQVVYKNDKFLEFWKDTRKRILEKNKYGYCANDVGSLTLGYRLDTARTGSIAPVLIYSKGAFVVHMLRMLMWDRKTGDARFSDMLKDYVQTCYNRDATTADFKKVVEKHMIPEMNLGGNGNMDWFFNEWVYGTEIPHYKIDYTLTPADGGKCNLVCTVSQSNVDKAFKMRVPIYLDFKGQVVRLGSVVLNGNSASPEIRVTLPKTPTRVLLNGYEDVLCTMDER